MFTLKKQELGGMNFKNDLIYMCSFLLTDKTSRLDLADQTPLKEYKPFSFELPSTLQSETPQKELHCSVNNNQQSHIHEQKSSSNVDNSKICCEKKLIKRQVVEPTRKSALGASLLEQRHSSLPNKSSRLSSRDAPSLETTHDVPYNPLPTQRNSGNVHYMSPIGGALVQRSPAGITNISK